MQGRNGDYNGDVNNISCSLLDNSALDVSESLHHGGSKRMQLNGATESLCCEGQHGHESFSAQRVACKCEQASQLSHLALIDKHLQVGTGWVMLREAKEKGFKCHGR